MSEQNIRETWAAFCAAANESKDRFFVRPGATINDPPAISEIGSVKREVAPTPTDKPKEETLKPVRSSPVFGAKKKDDAAE